MFKINNMKRYDIIGEPTFDLEEFEDGYLIKYDEFVDFISARIKELETEIDNEESTYSVASCRFRIDELKNLIK